MTAKTLPLNGPPDLLITIECHITQGLPSVVIVGYANRAVEEAKERLRAAFHASKLTFPRKRITINLAPADIPKDGTGFDLGMAVAIMRADGMVPELPDAIWIGELGLDGSVRAVRGIIGQLIHAKALGYQTAYIPSANIDQAKLIPDLIIMPVNTIGELFLHLTGKQALPRIETTGENGYSTEANAPPAEVHMEDIGGHALAKRVLEIAAAGGHNVLLSGPPGTGKSMLAKALASILPPMSPEEQLEVTNIHSLATHHFDKLVSQRPFRAPHHSASLTSVVGGGPLAKPGEVSLAHRGVLFLDELPEYHRNTIEALRQPLEDKRITITRAHHSAEYLADCMLVATSNPCPCGYHGSAQPCVCQPYQVIQYQRRLSGPLLDRIDLFSFVEAVEHAELLKNNQNETSTQIRANVVKARRVQAGRFGSAARYNALMTNQELKALAKPDASASSLLNLAASNMRLSARAYMRTLKVARTIADLAESATIQKEHIAEALQYRRPTQT